MRRVFADTLYWIAVTRPGDQWSEPSRAARALLGRVHIVTTDEVLTEFVNALSEYGDWLRLLGVRAVHAILADPNTTVVPQTHDSFLNGLKLHEARRDKEYSLTDCISMATMAEHGITQVLTHDHHFEQEGFVVLIKPH